MSLIEKLAKQQSKLRSLDILEEKFDFTPKYNDDCPAIAFEVLANGGTQAQIAARIGVSIRTIEKWKKPVLNNGEPNSYYKPEFAQAYLLGHAANVAYFDEIAKKQFERPNKAFNPVLYIYERKRRFAESEHRAIELPELANAKTYGDKAKAILKCAIEGQITPDELQKYTASLDKLAQIIELDKLIADVKMLKAAAQNQNQSGEINNEEKN